jgi:hypothetical protein
MTDVLIRDVPDAALAGIDAYSPAPVAHVATDDLRVFALTYADLADDDVTDAAWR